MAALARDARRWCGALVVGLLLCPPALADREEAKRLYAEGTQHYQLGRFEQAAEMYEKAYEAEPLPPLLFNIAQAYLEAGNGERAVFFFESYLRELPDAANRELVLQRIDEAREALKLAKQAEVAEAERQRAELEATRAERERQRAAEERAKLEVQARAQEAAARAREAEATAAAVEAEARAAVPVYEQTWFWPTIGTGAALAAIATATALTATGVAVVWVSASNADTLEPVAFE
jgi:tetratricopeptide (TPR) repeat protein